MMFSFSVNIKECINCIMSSVGVKEKCYRLDKHMVGATELINKICIYLGTPIRGQKINKMIFIFLISCENSP